MKSYVDISTTSGTGSKLTFSGFLNISKEVPGPLELTIDINQCDTLMRRCDKYPSVRITAFCQKLKDKNTFYYEALSKVNPPFECPLKSQTYFLTNGSVDFSAFSFIPLSETLWIINSKIFSGKKRDLAMCISSEYKIVSRRKGKRNGI